MRTTRLLALLFTFFFAAPLLAVWPKPPYSQWPCAGSDCVDTNNCYSFRAYSLDDALQYKTSDKSPRSTTEPTSPYGICSGYNGWCKLPPQLGSVTSVVIPGDDQNGPRVQLFVPYDFPNNYCQVYDDGAPCRASVWPPKQTLFSPVTRLTVYAENGEPLAIAPAVFETGTWTPTLDIGCGQTMTFIVEAKNGGEFVPGCTTDHTVRQTITVTADANACNPDRRCEDCGSGGESDPPHAGGKPIHFGSGDVNVNLDLFSIAQTPLSLSMSLAYHSSRPMFPNAPLPAPLGSGWTHSYNDVLLPIDPGGFLLYRVDGQGLETVYERTGINQWSPRLPAELRGGETVTSSGGQYRITQLDGTVIAFSNGRWISTTDRWGNAITGAYDGANLASITDSAGRIVTLSYIGNRLTSIRLPAGETWRFDGAPLSAIYDPVHAGAAPWRAITYLPDGQGVSRLLHELSDESGAVLEGHEYDALGRGRASYAQGNRDRMTVTYGANSAHVVTAIDGGQTQVSDFTFIYQKGRYLTTSITGSCASCGDAGDESQSFTYDANNRVISATDGNGRVTRYTYDALGNILTRTEAAGTPLARTTAYAYESPTLRDLATKVIEPSAAKPGAQKITSTVPNAAETLWTLTESGYQSPATAVTRTSTTFYDARHRPTGTDGWRTDAADTTSIAYYADDDPNPANRGRPRTHTDAAGLVITFDDYDTYGTPRRTVDANGVVTRVTTDAIGRTIQSVNEPAAGDSNETASYTAGNTYDGRDRLVSTSSPRGNGVAFEYEDGTNRLVATIRLDGNGRQVERQYTTRNAAGDPVIEELQVCTSWATKRSESYTYDGHNRLKEVVHSTPAGAKTIYGYDRNGEVVTIRDENHTAPNTSYAYDALGRRVSMTRTLAGAPGGAATTSYAYDVMDNLVSVTDANGNVTRYAHDDFARVISEESPVSGTTTFSYDPAGNLLSRIDGRGVTTTFTYDAAGRTLTATSNGEAVVYTYDDGAPHHYGKGRLASMTDPSGSTTYAYERRGLLRSESKTILGDAYVTAYEYDQNGNRSAILYPSGRRAAYTFDFADRPLSLTGTLGGSSRTYVSDARYLPFGPEAARQYGASISHNAAYDTRYRLTAFDVRSGAATLADHRYGYDAAGNVITIADALDPRYSRSFAYDDLDRLTRADSGAALWGAATYDYDPLGNRLAHALGSRVSAYTYRGTTSQLQSVTETGRGTRNVDYDAAGNERQAGNTTFTYSARNLLAEADGVRYLYDGRGVRVAQVGLSVGPIVTMQPASQPVCPGGSVTLTVTASGATAFQWQSSNDGASWQDISGATSRSLTATPSAPAHYRVVVSNGAASTTSNAATITPTALATEPGSGILYGDVTHDGTVNAGDVAALRAALAGLQPLGVPQAVADLDGDGVVNAVDLSLLGGFSGGTVTCLPRFHAFTAGASLLATTMTSASRIATNQAASNPTQYFFYSTELALLAETSIQAGGGRPAIAIEYLWFNGVPVAEERIASAETRLTFTDHLGTPFLQTSTSGTPVWQVEYEPFGTVYATRTGNAADQRLRFPGQEYDDQTPERQYNVHRWYRAAWGRYTQSDPIGLAGGANLYAYTLTNPLREVDPDGLSSRNRRCCGLVTPPEYNVAGTVPGGTAFRWHAKFKNDSTHDPNCCEVRQHVMWDRGRAPLRSFTPPNDQPGHWYEDRDDNNKRYGRRTGPYRDPQPYDRYHGDEYDGSDRPRTVRRTLSFRVVVVDVCRGVRPIYTSKTIHVVFP